jgi:hypothetical protein
MVIMPFLSCLYEIWDLSVALRVNENIIPARLQIRLQNKGGIPFVDICLHFDAIPLVEIATEKLNFIVFGVKFTNLQGDSFLYKTERMFRPVSGQAVPSAGRWTAWRW